MDDDYESLSVDFKVVAAGSNKSQFFNYLEMRDPMVFKKSDESVGSGQKPTSAIRSGKIDYNRSEESGNQNKPGKPIANTCPICDGVAVYSRDSAQLTSQCASGHKWHIGVGGHKLLGSTQ